MGETDAMVLALYRLLLSPSAPLLRWVLDRRLRRGKEDAARLGERMGKPGLPRPAGPLVWLHAASVGESISLLSLVDLLHQKRPDLSLLMTTGTLTSARLMAQRLPAGVLHQFVPVDHPAWVARFLDHWRPDAVIWSESEFWPNLLSQVKARHIPAALINARMSERSFARWRRVPATARALLSVFQIALGQNAAEAQRLSQLGAPRAVVSGNLKYAAAPLPDAPAARAALAAAIGTRPLVLWASTHPGEEEIAARVHRQLKDRHADVLTVIVPRHPNRGEALENELAATGMNVARRSQQQEITPATDIYLADTLGELGLFYRLCPTVVMGGTFADIGGHNPIEPAQLGAVIYCGPQLYNFLTIRDEFRAQDAMIEVADEAALVQALDTRLADPAATDQTGRNAAAWTGRQSQVLQDIYDAIAPVLPKGETP